MFGRLFGRKKNVNEAAAKAESDAAAAADEAFSTAKQASLERVLGAMDEMVFHALIPFFIGGGLDLYTFSACIPGTVFATQELIGREPENRPMKGRLGHFELVACLPPGLGRDDEAGVRLINQVLNPIAQYAFDAVLSPGETAELPVGEGDETMGLLFDEFNPKGVAFEVSGERFGLLLCMPIHKSGLVFARSSGAEVLIKKLRSAGAWPYADLTRAAVV